MVADLIPVGIAALMISPSLSGSSTTEAAAWARLLVVLTVLWVLGRPYGVLVHVPLFVEER